MIIVVAITLMSPKRLPVHHSHVCSEVVLWSCVYIGRVQNTQYQILSSRNPITTMPPKITMEQRLQYAINQNATVHFYSRKSWGTYMSTQKRAGNVYKQLMER